MLRSLLAPLRNIHDHRHETPPDDSDAQFSVLVGTVEGGTLADQVKSLVEELKLAGDTHSRVTVSTWTLRNWAAVEIHRRRLADSAVPFLNHRRAFCSIGYISRSRRFSCVDACAVDGYSGPICIVQSSLYTTSLRLHTACVHAHLEGVGSTPSQFNFL